jgi:hypothetical protein
VSERAVQSDWSFSVNPPPAKLYITYVTLDDAPLLRAFLNILNPSARAD